jgi:hypothetical protein
LSNQPQARETPIHVSFFFVPLIVFVATLIRSAFGFGEAMVAVPLLALCIPLRVATPLAVLLSICVAAIVVVHDWKKIHLRSAGWLVASTVLGIPLGLMVLTSRHQMLVKCGLALFLLLFSLYSLAAPKPFSLDRDSRPWMFACGFAAGVLGGAYGINGPPLVIYGTLRRWSAQHFRATLQAYFLPASLLGMTGYWTAGLWTREVTRDFLFSLPAMVPAVFLGRIINHRFSDSSYLRYVYIGLACIGVVLLAETLSGRV